jgi:aryl-alcohol dehydrogenase-like predicted oxidoreductase
MQYTTLGSTGLNVSVAGLGCGGNSRLGLGTGSTDAQAVAVVRAALDLGVNFLDTAEAYATEHVVGEAVAGRRDKVVISSKCRSRTPAGPISGADAVKALDNSLRLLKTDYVDIYHLHAVAPANYDHAMKELAPALLREKEKGKLRHLGVTETGPNDPKQEMMARAIAEPPWEVVMLAYSMMNQGARRAILPTAKKRGIGTLLMFVVRNIFSRPAALKQAMADLAAAGQVPDDFAKSDAPLSFLVRDGGATSLTDAAYRFVRHEPGVDVVLFGTGRQEHLRANIDSILRPPLPEADMQKLRDLFGKLVGVGLDLPDGMRAPAKA